MAAQQSVYRTAGARSVLDSLRGSSWFRQSDVVSSRESTGMVPNPAHRYPKGHTHRVLRKRTPSGGAMGSSPASVRETHLYP